MPNGVYIDITEISQRGDSIYGVEYLRDIKWKRNLHAKSKTRYIELQVWRWGDLSIYKYLALKLAEFGVPMKRKPESEILGQIKANGELDAFLDFAQNFLSLHKNGNLKLREINERFAAIKDKYLRERSLRFLRLYSSYYLLYQEYLDAERGYDFADMINIATQNVRELPGCASGYRYILLDEVQDLSRNRQELILAILQKNPSCKLFAVGDDWQSIYRFTGSNLELIRKFDQVFQRPTRRSLIESTHRFALPTLKISSEFVQKNPMQARKHVRSGKKTQTPIEIIFNEPDEAIRGSDAPAFERAIKHLVDELGFEKLQAKELQIISRYNHDIARLSNSPNFKIDGATVYWRDPQDSAQCLKFEYCSMHKSKGITRDIVFVLNMNSDLMGMPAQRETDPIIDTLLSQEESFPFAEERRLFYVAITRARERTILLANRKNPSPFLFEVCSELAQEENLLCPKCETGELIRKTTKRGNFYYCGNYRFGCDYFRRL